MDRVIASNFLNSSCSVLNKNDFSFNDLEQEDRELSVSYLDDTQLPKELCILKSNTLNIPVNNTNLDVSGIVQGKEIKVEDADALLLPMDNNNNFLSDWNKIIENDLYKKCDEVLKTNYEICSEKDSEININLIKYGFSSVERGSDGRLQFNLFWYSQVSHLLPRNFCLAKSILKSFKRKLDMDKIMKIDEVFKTQEVSGIKKLTI